MRTLLLAATLVAATAAGAALAPAAAACDPDECADAPCTFEWRYYDAADGAGFWAPYVECDA